MESPKFNVGDIFYINLDACEKEYQRNRSALAWINYCRKNVDKGIVVQSTAGNIVYDGAYNFRVEWIISKIDLKKKVFKDELNIILKESS